MSITVVMNIKQWIGLLILYVGYLLLGAMVFYYLERDHEIAKRNEDYQLYKDLLAILQSCGLNKTATLSLEGYCGRPLTENADIDDVSAEYWSFYKSVFFVLTVVSTVGFGNIHPTMPLTRFLMILYAVIGLPINAILLTSLASFFSSVFIRAHRKYKRYESRFGLTVDVLTYLIPGILFFIFVPATAFYYFEEWTYEESIYFAFVSLTTIGFGDYVAGQGNYKSFGPAAVIVYKLLLLGWIIFGLGYLIMLLEYLTRAMRSKKVVKLEQKLVEVLTNSKIWNGFTKDMGYLRRVMNELYLDKFKPVFRDERLRFNRKHTFRRSKSLPNIVFGVDEESLFEEEEKGNRKRTQSEYIPRREGLTRVFSESDLTRIDRHATFASATAIRPSELLRQVVGAMEDSITKQDDSLGINVFSDDEILESEGWYDTKNSFAALYHPPSYEDIVYAKKKRERAISDILTPRSNPHTITASSNLRGMDLTWAGSGANKIFEIINEQHKRNLARKSSRARSPSSSFLSGSKWFKPLRRKRNYSESTDGGGSKLSINHHHHDVRFLDNIKISESGLRKTSLCEGSTAKYRSDMSYITHTAGTGTKGLGLMHGKMNLRHLENHPSSKHSADLFKTGSQRLLNETSLGDFLRALTTLHNRVGVGVPEESSPEDVHWKIPEQSTPPPLSHRSLIDLSPPKISTAHSKLALAKTVLPRTESMPIPNDVPDKEHSNLRRLGRFLLRSYSPRSESNADLSFSQFDKSSDLESSNHTPSVQIQITPQCSFGRPGIIRSNTMDSTMSPKKRRHSTFSSHFRPSASTESVYPLSEGKGLPQTRQTSLKWRAGSRIQGETCSSKPSLSNVKELIN